MYKVIEVKSITCVLIAVFLLFAFVAFVSLGWLWGHNQILRVENQDLSKTAVHLTVLVDKANSNNKVLMERIATIGMGNMALLNHACGPRPVREATMNFMDTLNTGIQDSPFYDPFDSIPTGLNLMTNPSSTIRSDLLVVAK